MVLWRVLPLCTVILPLERHAALVQCDESGVGDRHPVGVARQIRQHCRRPGKRAFGIDHPFALASAARASRRRPSHQQAERTHQRTATAQRDAPCSSSSRKRRRNKRDSTRTGRKKPGLHAIQRSPSNDRPPPGTMPCTWGWCVSADPQVCSTSVAPIRAPRCLGSAAMVRSVSAATSNSRPIDHRLVVIGDGADRCRQGEHHMVIVHRQQLGLPRFEPTPGGTGLALRAMPVAAGVVGDLVMFTGRAMQHMSAQRRAAALFDGGHDLQLTQAQVTCLSSVARRVRGLRKISATSRAGRPMDCTLLGRQRFQRTDHLAQQVGGHLGIERGGLQFACARAVPGSRGCPPSVPAGGWQSCGARYASKHACRYAPHPRRHE